MSAPEDLLLAIESSCDESAVALIAGGTTIVTSLVASQIELHRAFGGVLPELASRAHLELLTPLVAEALSSVGIGPDGRASDGGARIVAVGATYGPGLIGPLLVGVSTAKSLALAWGVPFVGVNHLEGHLYGSLLEHPEMEFPAVVLLVSGGHTLLIEMEAPGRYRLLGRTLDDAAGEAFDKVARFLGLGYPGGPVIERAASEVGERIVRFTPPMLDDEGLDCSFSGLKTAVVNFVTAHPDVDNSAIAAGFQHAVIEVLVEKTARAAARTGARSVCVAGGVGANGPLRAALADRGSIDGWEFYAPSRAMCTDNAAMIAAAAYHRLEVFGPSPLSLGAQPGLPFP